MDVQITEQNNGGDLTIKTNDLSVVTGVENMPYLAMFGGSEWWGNDLLLNDGQDFKFSAETEEILLTIPLNSSGRSIVENAIKRDLAFLLNDVANTTLTITTRITSDNRLEILVKFAGGEFYLLWNPLTKQSVISPTLPKLTIWVSPIRSGESLTYATTGFSLLSGVTTHVFPAMVFYSNVDELSQLAVLNALAVSYGMTGVFVISGDEFNYNKGFSEDWEISVDAVVLPKMMKAELRAATPSGSSQAWSYRYAGINSYQVTDWVDGTAVDVFHPVTTSEFSASHTYADGLTTRFVNIFHSNTLLTIMRFNNTSTAYLLNNIIGVVPKTLTIFIIFQQSLKPISDIPLIGMSALTALQVIESGVLKFTPALFVNHFPVLNNILLRNNRLTTTIVDAIFNDFVANTPESLLHGGTIIINGQTPAAPPTAASLTARTALIGAGWSITTD